MGAFFFLFQIFMALVRSKGKKRGGGGGRIFCVQCSLDGNLYKFMYEQQGKAKGRLFLPGKAPLTCVWRRTSEMRVIRQLLQKASRRRRRRRVRGKITRPRAEKNKIRPARPHILQLRIVSPKICFSLEPPIGQRVLRHRRESGGERKKK